MLSPQNGSQQRENNRCLIRMGHNSEKTTVGTLEWVTTARKQLLAHQNGSRW